MGVKSDLQRQMRALREGRGEGQGADYKPWIQLRRHDFASRGRSHFHPSAFMDRHVELLSDLELCVYLHLQALNPAQVREQYPLRLDGVEPEFEHHFPEAAGTIAIAEQLKFKHPIINSETARIFSTDALVNFHDGRSLAIHVKYEKDLDGARATELRTIESNYWRQRGVEFAIATEKDFNKKVLGNLHMLSSFDRANLGRVDFDWLTLVVKAANLWPMNEAVRFVEKTTSLTNRQVVDRIKFAIATGRLTLDLSRQRLNWLEFWPELTVAKWIEGQEEVAFDECD